MPGRGGGGGRAVGPIGTERDGERKREPGVTGRGGDRGESRRCGGSGWMPGEDCARRVRKREGGCRAGGGGGGRGGSGFGATSAMSVCTRTPSRPRRVGVTSRRNPHRKRQAAPQAAPGPGPDPLSDAASIRRACGSGSDGAPYTLRLTSRIALRSTTTTTTPAVATFRRRQRRRRRRLRLVCARDFVIHVAAVKCVYATAQRYVTDVWIMRVN
ncbi:hypothetical protein ALC62_08439 [Cyphomyrmex costatus]|uniref:Uncharacterized protein n=1 Tax=Cyphomyrmex costatus TaxID=456900 RepID=A0A195CJ38_9HYME|nr:hypothetical protein ALC62_08439 [Cyphomyrmex costatus]